LFSDRGGAKGVHKGGQRSQKIGSMPLMKKMQSNVLLRRHASFFSGAFRYFWQLGMGGEIIYIRPIDINFITYFLNGIL